MRLSVWEQAWWSFLAMMATAGIVAVLVYRVVGLRILRTAWINLERIWAAAFVVAGVLMGVD